MLVKIGAKVAGFEGTVVGTVFGSGGGDGLIVISPKYLYEQNDNRILTKKSFLNLLSKLTGITCS